MSAAMRFVLGFLMVVSVQAQAQLPEFTNLVDTVSPAVVNISTTQEVKQQRPQRGPQGPQVPPGSPFEDFFRKFGDEDRQRRASSLGSGFIIDDAGIVVTNFHVIENAEEITVTLADETTFVAEVLGQDQKTDIAVLKIDPGDTQLTAVPFGDSDNLRVGDWVLAIGNPFGLGGTVTAGIVSARGRDINNGPYDDFIQTDADINPGNSGGPLVNIQGEAVGVNTMIRGLNTGIGFAIPINMAMEIAEQVIETGTFRRALLGIGIETLTDNYELNNIVSAVSKGVIVSSINADSAAGESNLKPADIIIAVGGKPVASAQQLKNQVRSKSIGKALILDVVRNKERLQIEVKPREWKRPPVTAITANEPRETPTRPVGLKLRKADETGAKQFGVPLQEGLMIWEIEKGSLADNWLTPGEIITDVNFQAVRSPFDFARIYRDTDLKRKGLVIVVHDARGNKRLVILKERNL